MDDSGARYLEGDEVLRGGAYYAYTTIYTKAIAAVQGTTYAPAFAFEGADSSDYAPSYYVDNSVVVDGKTLVGNYGPIGLSR